MSKKRQENRETSPTSPSSPQPRKTSTRAGLKLPWHPAWRWLVSLLVVLHLLAVFAAPWSLSTSPALPPGYVPRDANGRPMPNSPPHPDDFQRPRLIYGLADFFHYYLNLTYLNHGYQFFAPDPAGTHLIRYWVYDSQGQKIDEKTFPDLKEQWPRLLYHRHMMLTEQAQELVPDWGRMYGQHLIKKYGATHVRMERGFHHLLTPQQVLAGKLLDASDTYETVATVDEYVHTSDLLPAPEQPVAIPGGER